MRDSQFPFRCTPVANARDFSCNSPVISSCHIAVQSLCKMADNHPGQTSLSTETKLVPNNASSTNTVNKLIVPAINLKRRSNIFSSPSQSSPAAMSAKHPTGSYIKGTIKYPSLGWFQLATHSRFPPNPSLSQSCDCTIRQQHVFSSTAAVAFLPRYTRTCANDLGTRFAKNMLAIYGEVAQDGKPNFIGTQVTLPSNLQFQEWSIIAYRKECSVFNLAFLLA